MPTFDPDTLPQLTRDRLPHLAEAEITVQSLAGDGSDRTYSRLQIAAPAHDEPQSIVVMHFDTERVENLSFTPVTLFLRSIGVACPEIYSYDENRHLIWLQDLGQRDLYALRNEPWESVRRPLYEGTLREAAKIHAVTQELFEKNPAAPVKALQRPFDASLYRWEQNYFFENFVQNFSDLEPAAAREIAGHPALRNLADELDALPRTLIHRDFQSRNVIVKDNQTFLIDYQGMRFGLPEYDLASLLFDPYVSIRDEDRTASLGFYHELNPRSSAPPEILRDRFLKCAAQRLMQALGAYGYLGLVKEKPHFLDSIPKAVHRLTNIVRQVPLLAPLEPVLKTKNLPEVP